MRISQLITFLQRAQEEVGDILVVVDIPDFGHRQPFADEVEISTSEEKGNDDPVLVI